MQLPRSQTEQERLTPKALEFSNCNELHDDSESLLWFGFRARLVRAFEAKNASGSLESALVAYEQQRRVG
jgi:hypothetical protein